MRPNSPAKLKNISRMLRVAASERVVFGDVTYAPRGSCGPRVQADFQLVVIEEGVARVQVDGGLVVLTKGEAGLFLPGRRELFEFSATHRTHHTWCAVGPGLVDEDLRVACEAAPVKRPVSHRLAQLLELGLGLPEAAGREAPGLVDALGVAALREYVFAAGAAGAGLREQPDAMRRLLEWFGLHAAEAVDLSGLANVAGVSSAQLVKLCKRHLGVTPVRALWEARTRQGVRMLRDTGLTVSEVAYRCGFQTPFHFSRWVRALTGKNPRAVRSDAWAGRRD